MEAAFFSARLPATGRLVSPVAPHAPDFVDELVDVLEIAVHGGKTHIGHLVDLAQGLHRAVADLVGRHLAFVIGLETARNLGDDHVDRVRLHVAFPAGLLDPRPDLVRVEILARIVALHDLQFRLDDLLVRGEPVSAGRAFTATAHGRAVFRGAGVDHAVFLAAASGATHSRFLLN